MGDKKKFIKPELTIEELSAALYMSKEELNHTNQQLAEANEKLRQEEINRTELLSNISHDLRTPITAIKSTIEYMNSLDKYDASEMKALGNIMKRRIVSLERLVNDFFLLTTIENASLPFHMQKIQIGILLEEFFFSRKVDDQYNQRRLVLDVPELFPYKVEIDPIRLEQALDNLFTNSLKYSDTGDMIKLSSNVVKDKLFIIVEDSGIGIPADKIDKIFKRSYMVDESRTPNAQVGCGLGLTIVMTIIKRMRGNVSCESQEGKGSKFIITLPVAE